MASQESPAAEMLFEISWEVCNKVGGIHTVIKSKLSFIEKLYDNYVLIGPDLERRSPEFEARDVPDEWKEIFEAMGSQGIECTYGSWLTSEEPAVILINFRKLFERSDEFKHSLWENYRIDSLQSSFEFDEPMCFAFAAGILIDEYSKKHPKPTVAQCHEWMTGFALLYLKQVKAKVATVFTTHATILGRTIAGNGHSLYEIIDEVNPEEWAANLKIQDKHLTEKACAHNADVFTTVSEITGMEAEKLLGRKPDVLLFNGFYTDKFPTFEETSIRHYEAKESLKDFLAYTFFPHYAFDLEKMLIFFTSGRYEFGNKGIDVLIDATSKLNQRLKDEEIDITIVMMFWVIMGRQGVKFSMLENKNFYQDIRSSVEWQSKPLVQKIILDFLSGHPPGKGDIFTSSFINQIHANVSHFHRDSDPPISTHEIPNEEHDPILNACRANNLTNKEEDKVKVVLYPGYLDGSDGLLNLQYYDATVGTHLGVFPSAYEPWGYTPLESAVLGVPTITTDLAGFGRFIESCDQKKCKGIFIIERQGRKRDDVVQQLADQMFEFATLEHEERVQHGYAAKDFAARCNWKKFVLYYVRAHNLALERY